MIARPTLSAVLLSTLVTGCVADGEDAPVQVLNNMAQDPDTCVPDADEGNALSASGLIDGTLGTDYYLLPLLKNYATEVDEGVDLQRTANLRGARVSVAIEDRELVPGGALTALAEAGHLNFEVPMSVSIGPNDLLQAFTLAVPHEVLGAVAQAIQPGDSAIVRTTTTFFGNMGGGEFESSAFPFPVEVCNGCGAFHCLDAPPPPPI